MTESVFTPEAIAEFLKENPNFLEEHSEVFFTLRLPNPNGAGTLSLLEHQVNTLRKNLQKSQEDLQELDLIAYENQGINDTIMDWCATLLAQKEEELIPAAIVTGLQDAFPELEIELILWGLENLEDYQREDNEAVKNYISSLGAPYTGKNIHEGIVAWLSESPASIAIAPIYVNDAVIGALVFSSQDPKHFYEGMGTLFLENLSYLTSASLSRLAPSIMETPIEEETLDDDDYPELDPV